MMYSKPSSDNFNKLVIKSSKVQKMKLKLEIKEVYKYKLAIFVVWYVEIFILFISLASTNIYSTD